MKSPRRIILTPFDRDLYETTGNGLHAWDAYRISRQRNGWPAEWVLEYFDRCAEALGARGATASPAAISEALELRTRRGGESAGPRATNARRAQAIVTHINLYRRRAGWPGKRLTQVQTDEILYRVSEESGLNYDRTRAIWFKWKPKVSRTR